MFATVLQHYCLLPPFWPVLTSPFQCRVLLTQWWWSSSAYRCAIDCFVQLPRRPGVRLTATRLPGQPVSCQRRATTSPATCLVTAPATLHRICHWCSRSQVFNTLQSIAFGSRNSRKSDTAYALAALFDSVRFQLGPPL